MEHLLHELDRDNFFYENIAVMTYSQFGTCELFARGFTMQIFKNHKTHEERIEALKEYEFPQEVNDQILNCSTFTPMILVPGFETVDRKTSYRMDPNHSAIEHVEVFRGITDAKIEIARMTILSTFEKAKNATDKDSEVMEFFRHIRNAAAHEGHFKITSHVTDKTTGKLKKPAKWKNFEIEPKLDGKRFLAVSLDGTKSFWRLGDLVEFLLDFENHHPEIKKP